MRKLSTVIVTIALLLAIGFVDYATGIEVRLFPLYFIPVSLVAWRFGIAGGIVTSFATTAAWEFANRSAGRVYSSDWIGPFNLVAMLSAFLTISALAAAQRRNLDRESSLARLDALTGAANGRSFFELAEREIARVRRTRSPLTLAYLDIDNFKTINDTLGHPAGDEVLIATASLLRSSCRATDSVARLGGDEFALLLPDTTEEAAHIVLTKIRDRFRATSESRGWSLSLSVGAVTCLEPPTSVEELLKHADGLMYEVKRSGKNSYRVVLAES